jgi:deoxyadenosine/deoxycytidine kinase
MEHDWSVLADAMRREVERGGQVYYLHNRVETIARTASRIQEMLGDRIYNKALDDAKQFYAKYADNMETDYYALYKDIR